MSFIPVCFVLAVDRAVDRTRGRSTGPVDRCAQERARCQPLRPVDSTVNRLKFPYSWVRAVDRAVDRRLRPVDRAVDRR